MPFTWEPLTDFSGEAAHTAAEGGDFSGEAAFPAAEGGDFTREAGLLRFTVDTALDPNPATYLYEIVREDRGPSAPRSLATVHMRKAPGQGASTSLK